MTRLIRCNSVPLATLVFEMDVTGAHGKVTGRFVTGVSCEAHRVRPGELFVDLGEDDGSGIELAIERGAVAVVCRGGDWSYRGVTTILVADPRRALALAARAYCGAPDTGLAVIPVVGGGAGCTSTAFFLFQALHTAGLRPALFGRVHHEIGGRVIPALGRVLESPEFYQMLRQCPASGCRAAVSELTRDDILRQRAGGLQAAAVVLAGWEAGGSDEPGLGDEAWFLNWLRQTGTRSILGRHDDPVVQRLLQRAPAGARVVTYGLDPRANIVAERVCYEQFATRFRLHGPFGTFSVRLPLPGRQNLVPALAAVAAAASQGLDPETLQQIVEHMMPVPGCLEPVADCGPARCFVDAARTPAALNQALRNLRELVPARLMVVIGSPEGRDAAQRADLGMVAEQLADTVVVTADNPGSEPFDRIAREMLDGATAPERVIAIADRRAAIAWALAGLGEGDILLVAGKGQEHYQDLGDTLLPWDDRHVLRETARALEQQRAVPAPPAAEEMRALA